jgi:hypothetical protein
MNIIDGNWQGSQDAMCKLLVQLKNKKITQNGKILFNGN